MKTNWKQWIPYFGVDVYNRKTDPVLYATYHIFVSVVLILLFVTLVTKCTAQGTWSPVDTQTFVLTSISFDSEGDMWSTRQQGDVYENGILVTHINTRFDNEMGLVNLIWAENAAYVHVTGTDTVQRVIRYRSDFSAPDTLIEVSYLEPGNSPPYSNRHLGGGLAIVGDTVLYASFGVGSNPAHTLDLSDLRGKIVAYNLLNNSMFIAAFGVRNPFRITFDPEEDWLWFSDAGTTIAEEINLSDLEIDSMTFFGFPCLEGVTENPDTIYECDYEDILPVHYYHQDPNRAIIGGAVWNGAYFWTDYISGHGGYIEVLANTPMETPIGITCMAVNPITNELFACKWTGVIYRYEPDSIILAIPENGTIINSKFTPDDEDLEDYYEEMLTIYGYMWFDTSGHYVGSTPPEIPGLYIRAIRDRHGFIKKEWFVIPQ